MLVSSFMSVISAKWFLNQKKAIVAFIAHTELYLVHQFKKIEVVVDEKSTVQTK
jgi:hypothetical protein